jgi:hypothetical protein
VPQFDRELLPTAVAGGPPQVVPELRRDLDQASAGRVAARPVKQRDYLGPQAPGALDAAAADPVGFDALGGRPLVIDEVQRGGGLLVRAIYAAALRLRQLRRRRAKRDSR